MQKFNLLTPLFSLYCKEHFAPVVKWISRRSSEPLLGVRIPPGAPAGEKANLFAFVRVFERLFCASLAR